VDEIPPVVERYQLAHDQHDTPSALANFAPTAVVKDDGQTYRGLDEIRDWLSRASVEFNYERTLISVEAVDDESVIVRNHLEGDFPGGVVDLTYRFVVIDDRITELEIAP
jgi:hypothetical protein